MTQEHPNKSIFVQAFSPAIDTVELTNGRKVWVRELTVGDVDRTAGDVSAGSKNDGTGTRHRLTRAAAAYLCDEEGNQVFDPESPQDLAMVSKFGWANLRRVLDAGDRLNGADIGDEKNA